MSNKVAKRLRAHKYVCNSFMIGLKIKDGWLSKKYKISKYTHHDKDIFELCLTLINSFCIKKNGIYQVQVTATNLRPVNVQKDMFIDNQNNLNNIDYVIDDVNNKFGNLTLRPARLSTQLETPDVISPSWRPEGCKKYL
tara:strand:- start:659 stop:1075 length:417 start_codon:yes stop_codon:yes gene_type:complete